MAPSLGDLDALHIRGAERFNSTSGDGLHIRFEADYQDTSPVCSVRQHVAACCSVLQRIAACRSVLQRVAACCSGVLYRGELYCSVLQRAGGCLRQCRVIDCILHLCG